MPYVSNGTLKTDEREVAISETWDTQGDWEAYQSASGIQINSGVLSLSEIVVPDQEDLHSHFDASDLTSVDPWPNEADDNDLSATGPPTVLTGEKNGLNVVDYDGTDDYHATDFATEVSPPFQYFLVFKIDTLSDGSFMIGGQGPSGSTLADFRDDNNQWQIEAGQGVSGGSTDTNWHIANALFDGGDSKLRIDGTEIASGNPGTAGMDGMSIAELLRSAGREHDMKAGEFLLYPMDKTSVETDVESYLNDKWAVF